MNIVDFNYFISTLKNGEIRKNDLECRFIPENLRYKKNLIISKNNTCIDLLFKDKYAKEKRPFILFLPGYDGANHNTQFYPHASYFSIKYNAICAGLIFKDFNKYPFPEGLLDAIRVVKWINKNLDKYNIDKNKLYVVGGYIGGSIASMLATMNENQGLSVKDTIPLNINSAVSLGAPYDFKMCLKECEQKNRITKYLGSELITEDENKYKSSIFYVHNKMAKLLIVSGQCDKLVPVSNAEMMYKSMVKCNAEATIKKYKKAGHGWFNKEPYLFEIIRLMENYFFIN